MITTIEKLVALPVGSVIKTKDNEVLEKGTDAYWWGEDSRNWSSEEVHTYWTPATLLIPNTISQEKFREALDHLTGDYHRTSLLNALESTLEMLGIEVSDE